MPLPSLSLEGRVVFVTGTGTGLDRMDGARATVKEVEREGRRGAAVPLDVTSLGMIDEAVRSAVAAFGRIDVLVNNAGINIPQRALDLTEATRRERDSGRV